MSWLFPPWDGNLEHIDSMIVSSTRIERSPLDSSRIRHSVTVTYDDGKVQPEEWWFECAESTANNLTVTGNPWLAALLPLAAHLGGPLRIADAVDPLLLDGAFEALRLWNAWDRASHIVPIEVETYSRETHPSGKRIGSLFSGGVDSFFALLDNDNRPGIRPPVDELITVWGLDVPLERPDQIAIVQAKLDRIANQLGKSRVEVWTNVRSTRLAMLDWGRYSHGCALFAAGHFLEDRYWRLLVPSSYSIRHMNPWGSHIVVDPLFSSSRMRLKYASGHFARMEKVGFIKDFPIALENVRSCWRHGQGTNCSKCEKCLRTMLAFAGHGALDKCTAFDARQFSLEDLRNLRTNDEHNILDFDVILEGMPQDADPELRSALETCIARNRSHYTRLRKFERLEMTPWVGWLFGHYKRTVVAPKKRTG